MFLAAPWPMRPTPIYPMRCCDMACTFVREPQWMMSGIVALSMRLQHSTDEALELPRLGRGEQFTRRPLFPHPALMHEDQRVGGAPGETHLVRDQHHGHARRREALEN